MFDFERAHREIAAPLYRGLPKRVRNLVARVDQECAELGQNSNLDMPWPAAVGLREAFEQLDTNTLAHASQVVHEYGHWGSYSCLQENGTYWKFAHYCDQVLRSRLGVSQRLHQPGVSFGIHRGELRVYYASRNYWSNQCLGSASAGLFTAAQKSWAGCYGIEQFESALKKFQAAHPCGNLSDYGA